MPIFFVGFITIAFIAFFLNRRFSCANSKGRNIENLVFFISSTILFGISFNQLVNIARYVDEFATSPNAVLGRNGDGLMWMKVIILCFASFYFLLNLITSKKQ